MGFEPTAFRLQVGRSCLVSFSGVARRGGVEPPLADDIAALHLWPRGSETAGLRRRLIRDREQGDQPPLSQIAAWSLDRDSNSGPHPYHGCALPLELSRLEPLLGIEPRGRSVRRIAAPQRQRHGGRPGSRTPKAVTPTQVATVLHRQLRTFQVREVGVEPTRPRV